VKSIFTYFEHGAHGLVTKITPMGGTAVEFAYDALMRRIRADEGSDHTYFRHDGINFLEITTSAGSVTKLTNGYQMISGIGSVVEVDVDGTRYFLHLDHRGTVYKITDASGDVVWTGLCDAWGVALSQVGTNPAIFWYQGQAWWKLTVNGRLYYVSPTRIYDAQDGRFVERDPIQNAHIPSNAYTLVGTRTIDMVDPSGEESQAAGATSANPASGAGSPNEVVGTIAALCLAYRYLSRIMTGWLGRISPVLLVLEKNHLVGCPWWISSFVHNAPSVQKTIQSYHRYWEKKFRAIECASYSRSRALATSEEAKDVPIYRNIYLEGVTIMNSGLSDYVVNEARLWPTGNAHLKKDKTGCWWVKVDATWTFWDYFDVNSYKETVDRAGGFRNSILNPGNIPGATSTETFLSFISFLAHWGEAVLDITADKLQGAGFAWSREWVESYEFPCSPGATSASPWHRE
jgi:RHS repeat-associated protein